MKVWNGINPFLLRYSCWISPGWNRVSQLIYSAVWLTFCGGLPLGWKWASRKSMILFYVLWFVFYQPFMFDQYSLLWNEKQTLTCFSDTKIIWKELECHRSVAATIICHFSGIFCIRSSFISAYRRSSIKPPPGGLFISSSFEGGGGEVSQRKSVVPFDQISYIQRLSFLLFLARPNNCRIPC